MLAEKTRILHLSCSASWGGAERRTIDLAAALEEAGLKNYLGVPADSYMSRKARELGLETCPLSMAGSLDVVGIRKLLRVVRDRGIDIVHCHDGTYYWPCIFAKWPDGRNLRVVFHRRIQKPHHFYSRGHYRYADAVIAVSGSVKDQLVRRERVEAEKIHVVHDFVDFRVFDRSVSGEEVRRKHALDHRVVVGISGTMDPEKSKGELCFIEAARRLDADFPDVRYLIIGQGVSRPELETLTGEYGLADKVLFVGHQEEMPKYMAATDVFCLLSWKTEGLGNVLQEAQAMGKPVIGTSVGGIPETFLAEETGLLVAGRDVEDLARALRRLLEDEPLRRRMAERAGQLARERFGQERAVAQVLSVYESLLCGRARRTVAPGEA